MSNKANTLATLRSQLEALIAPGEGAIPIYPIADEDGLSVLSDAQRKWAAAQGWTPSEGAVLLLPGEDGAVAAVALGTGGADWSKTSPFLPGVLPARLPAGDYRFEGALDDPETAALAWLAGSYEFGRYKPENDSKPKRLVLPEGADKDRVLAQGLSLYFGRELINTPANDLGPAELEKAVRDLAGTYGAEISVTEGEMLLADNFPMIHAVGRASDRAPRLIDMTWGEHTAPKLTIVGKGICFDTGGLDIKPPSAMVLMKKDMGGAAAALALALLIMEAKLPVRLRVLIPSADNNISANAFRPGDVLQSRSGKTVEIGNTDAEGRLVLADALSLADEEAPDYLVTFATLTGAARSALGPDLPPLYSTDEDFAAGMLDAAETTGDSLWRMPFWAPYDEWLKSSIADVNHISQGPFAGSITAALFLKRFVTEAKRFAHLDIYGWVPRVKPGKPIGGEPQGARALFAFFEKTFPGKGSV
ncbi:leucyl aminopeptidase family protein [Methyloligella sp. 2.7D]|uniref:leucyl aminopeptidase family protein n=1 Tax=unclassified Methyloligella TaxID=2625955 RepID=UPI00157C0674|nr:leucyl aminopeptidase family protein [Methyloligella sp. GL2]QKP78580.1 leucyl aminopeptidase family protein [Methyloligella sp. GL2]